MLAGSLLLSCPRVARAEEPSGRSSCASLVVEVASGLDPGWAAAAEALKEKLAQSMSAEECSNVTVSLLPSSDHATVEVRVRAADERVTSRPVKGPQALFPVVFGLLAAPPPSSSLPPTAPSRREPALPELNEIPDFTPPARSMHPTAASPFGVFVGFGLGSRAGVPSKVVMADVELFADVVLHDWTIVASVRYAPIAALPGPTADGDQYEEAALGVGLGRELRWGRSSLDAIFIPTLVLVSMETDLPVEVSGTLASLRFDACARYGYSIGRTWRLNIALDTDVAPSGLVRPQYISPVLPPVPAWTLGLRFGASASLL